MDIKDDILHTKIISLYNINRDIDSIDEKLSESSLMKIIFSNFINNQDYITYNKQFVNYILANKTIFDVSSYQEEFYEDEFKRVVKTKNVYIDGLLCDRKTRDDKVVSSIEISIQNKGYDMDTEYNGYFYTNDLSGEFSFHVFSSGTFSFYVNDVMIMNDSGNANEVVGKITLEKNTYYPIKMIHSWNGGMYMYFSHKYIKKTSDGSGYFYHTNTKTFDIESSIPSINTKIIDYDISSYASNDIKMYLFYIDVIKEIYNNVYDLKKNNKSIITDSFNIRCRYVYTDNGISLYTRDNYYTIKMGISRLGINNTVNDFTITSDIAVSNLFNVFKVDILTHLNYLNGDDIKYSDQNYINDIKTFYQMCRMKLMYSIFHSMQLISNNKSDMEKILKMSVVPIFINLKEHIVISGENRLNNKSLLYSENVLSAKQDITDSRNKIMRSKDALKKYENKINRSKQIVQNTNTINIASIVTFVFVFISIITILSINTGKENKAFMSFAVLLVVIIVAIFFSKQQNIENFESAPNIKTVKLTSGKFNVPGEVGQWVGYSMPDVKLPDDYLDIGLQSWDYTIYGFKKWSNYGSWGCTFVLHDIVGINLPEGGPYDITADKWHSSSIMGKTNPLDPNKKGKITGVVAGSFPDWRDCYYELTIRYDLNKIKEMQEFQEKEKERQLQKLMEIERLNREIAEMLYKAAEAEKDYNASQKRLEKTQIEIKILEQEHKKAVENLDQQLSQQDIDYIKLLKQLAESKAVLEQKITEEKRVKAEIIKKEAEVEKEKYLLEQETQLKKESIENTQDYLNELRNRAVEEFNEYMSTKDKAELAEISYVDAEKAYKIIKLNLDQAETDVKNSTSESHAKYLLETAEINRQKLLQEVAAAKLKFERTSLELENKQKQLNVDQLQTANHELNKTLEIQKDIYERAMVDEETATYNKQLAENNMAKLLNDLNSKYNTNDKSIETLNARIQLMIAAEIERKSKVDKEAALYRLRELGNLSIESSANTIIDINNKLIDDANKNINYYTDVLEKNRAKLSIVEYEKRRLENEIAKITAETKTRQNEAEQRSRELDINTQIKINNLQKEKLTLNIEYADTLKTKELRAKEALEETNLREALNSQLVSITNEIQDLTAKKDYYSELTSGMEVADILEDVDVYLLYNINSNINTTNNDIILSRLKRKQKYLKEVSNQSANHALLSQNSINVKYVKNKEVYFVNYFIIGLSIALSLSILIYYSVNKNLALVVFIISMIILLFYLLMNINKIVRTNARNNYWQMPSQKI